MEIPPGADPDALDGARGEHLKQPQNVSQTQAGSAGSREIGNLVLLQVFELIQIATQSETFHLVLDPALYITLVKKTLKLTRHRGAQRRLAQVHF